LSAFVLSRDFKYCNECLSGWVEVTAALSVRNLPDPVQYPMETWEWTICRDYRDRIAGELASAL
jgi:hypothetical protein